MNSSSHPLPPAGAPAQRFFLLGIGLALLAAFAVALFLWSIDKGFDLTDEGFYILGLSQPEEYSSGFSSFHLIVAALLPAKHVSLVGYRAASLVMALAAAAALAVGIWQWIRATATVAIPYWVILLVLVIGNFLSYSIAPRTVSYNTLTSLCVATFVGSVLYYCAGRRGLRMYGFLSLGGTLLGMEFFIKGSSSVAALTVGLGVLVLTSGLTNFRSWLRPVMVVLGGYLAGMGLFFIGIQPAEVWYANFTSELRVLMTTQYNGSLVGRYLTDFKPLIKIVVLPFSLIIGGVFVLARMYRRQGGRLSPLVLGLAGVVFAVVFAYGTRHYGLYRNTHLNGNSSMVWFIVLVMATMALFVGLASRERYKQFTFSIAVVGLWLLALPFICAVGTVNNIFINTLVDINYWLAFLCLVYANLPPAVTGKVGVQLLLFLLPAVLIMEQFTYGLVKGPYMQAADMTRQTVPVAVGGLGKSTVLKLDPETAGFIKDLRQTLRGAGFQPATPIIAMYDLPGLVYLLDGISPGDPWLFGQRDLRNCHSLAKTRMDLKQAFLLVNEKPGPELLQCMREHGLRFPQDYVKLRTVANPYSHNLYNWRSYQDSIMVYAPAAARPLALEIN